MIIDFLRNIKYGIRNLIQWFPIIWNDRHWDHVFMLRIMIKKFSLMEEYFGSDFIIIADAKKLIENIKNCRIALEKLENESYKELGMKKYYEKYPFPDNSNFLEYINRERGEDDSDLFLKCHKLSNKLEKEYFNNFVKNFKHYREWWD